MATSISTIEAIHQANGSLDFYELETEPLHLGLHFLILCATFQLCVQFIGEIHFILLPTPLLLDCDK